MIKFENICKTYKNKKVSQTVLNDFNVVFREKEFVSIIGPSGSGKTTFLNIVGCLDNDYEGNYYVGNSLISKKKNKFYDNYRSKMIGFVFQDYALIEHLSVYKNIELALCVRKNKNKRDRIFEVLDMVELLTFSNTKVSKLSGGQKQRVAIARAIVNDPPILLLDEPTGALDKTLSIQIMDLIKKLAKNKLVIMVTHDQKIAELYSDRIIEISDGKIVNDTSECFNFDNEKEFMLDNKVSFSFIDVIKFAFTNLKVKFFRNLLTILAFSISIIGICLVISISRGVNYQVEILKSDTLSNYPIVISNTVINKNNIEDNSDEKKIYSYYEENNFQENIFSKEYLKYLDGISRNTNLGIVNHYEYNFNLLGKSDNSINLYNSSSFVAMPNDNLYLKNNYTILSGNFPDRFNEIVVRIDENNRLDSDIFQLFDLNNDFVDIDSLVGKKIKIVLNNNLYKKIGDNKFSFSDVNDAMYNAKDNITLVVSGVVKSKDNLEFNGMINEGVGSIYYQEDLMNKILNMNKNSDIVLAQRKNDYNVLTGEKVDNREKNILLKQFGFVQMPYMIYIYPNGFSGKEEIKQYLDNYNEDNEQIKYIDMGDDVVKVTKSLIFGIVTVLFLFSGIALVIVFILIIIMTYTSSLERRKEIGILKSMGMRAKDVKRLFVCETVILSMCSSVIGIVFLKMLVIPVNSFLYDLTELENLVSLDFVTIIMVLLIAAFVAIFGSFLPARNASRINPVKCLK